MFWIGLLVGLVLGVALTVILGPMILLALAIGP